MYPIGIFTRHIVQVNDDASVSEETSVDLTYRVGQIKRSTKLYISRL